MKEKEVKAIISVEKNPYTKDKKLILEIYNKNGICILKGTEYFEYEIFLQKYYYNTKHKNYNKIPIVKNYIIDFKIENIKLIYEHLKSKNTFFPEKNINFYIIIDITIYYNNDFLTSITIFKKFDKIKDTCKLLKILNFIKENNLFDLNKIDFNYKKVSYN